MPWWVVHFAKLSNQAEQLVPKETGGWLPCRMNGFHGNSGERTGLSKETCQWPCLVLALLSAFLELVYIAGALINSSFHGANPWNSFIPNMSPYASQMLVEWLLFSGKLAQKSVSPWSFTSCVRFTSNHSVFRYSSIGQVGQILFWGLGIEWWMRQTRSHFSWSLYSSGCSQTINR